MVGTRDGRRGLLVYVTLYLEPLHPMRDGSLEKQKPGVSETTTWYLQREADDGSLLEITPSRTCIDQRSTINNRRSTTHTTTERALELLLVRCAARIIGLRGPRSALHTAALRTEARRRQVWLPLRDTTSRAGYVSAEHSVVSIRTRVDKPMSAAAVRRVRSLCRYSEGGA